jgi:c(7)-type cytochrome triheme protein
MRRSVILSTIVAFAPVVLSVVIAAATARAQDANAMNRLPAAPVERNAPPAVDGLHDPAIEGTQLLQSPGEAFAGLPKADGGNYVNWTEALRSGKIAPRYDRLDGQAKPEVLQLDIVREVKRIWGGMPPAVFSHAAHSEWLDCPVCHPALFVAEKGKNTMTMAEIMVGRKCGVCHGTVAFPVAECKRCHYQPNSSGYEKTVSLKDSGRRKNGKRLRVLRQD